MNPRTWKLSKYSVVSGLMHQSQIKGSAKGKTNYKLVSCLLVLSKELEKTVCEQITNFMEEEGLLPENQQGFRTGRSTMSAL